MAGDFYPSDPQPTRMPTPAEVLDLAEAWGEKRRAGIIRDAGCDSVAAMLAEQDETVVER